MKSNLNKIGSNKKNKTKTNKNNKIITTKNKGKKKIKYPVKQKK